VTLSGPGATFAALSGFDFNSGSFTVTNGATYSSSVFFSNSGSITIGPGSTVSFDSLDVSSSGRLDLQIAGRPASNQFGKFVDTNGSTFDGTLDVTFVPGADTQTGDVYTLVTSNGISGTPAITQDGAGITPAVNVAVGATTVTATAAQSITDLSV